MQNHNLSKKWLIIHMGIFAMLVYWLAYFNTPVVPARVTPAHLTQPLIETLAHAFMGNIGQTQPYPANHWIAGPPRAGAFHIYRAGPSMWYPLIAPFYPVGYYTRYRSQEFAQPDHPPQCARRHDAVSHGHEGGIRDYLELKCDETLAAVLSPLGP